jgi:hypothetical protein
MGTRKNYQSNREGKAMSGKEELARLAYTIGKEVADNVGKKAAPIVAKAAKKVDDWVFKKKPNEISGNDYLNYYKKYTQTSTPKIPGSQVTEQDKLFRTFKNQWKEQLKNDPILTDRPTKTALTFAKLEDANMPRKYTGKVAKGLLKNKTIPIEFGDTKISDVMSRGLKGMNENQRETLISLLPEWDFGTSSIDDLISAAKNL